MKHQRYQLKNLSCANCAAKIEEEINKTGIISASINFAQGTIALTAEEHAFEDSLEKVKNIISRIEPEVKLLPLEKSTVESSHEHDHSHEHGHSHEHDQGDEKSVKRKLLRFGIGGLFFIGGLIFTAFWPRLTLFALSYLIIGGDILWRAGKNILRGQVFDENFLMAIATLGAFLIGEYPEGVFVMLFYQVGELFQDMAVGKSRRSIAALMDLRPEYANVKTADGVEKRSPEEVLVGDTIVVKPGEKVPLDAEILTGRTSLDVAALTGESLPREAEEGAEVLSGSINLSGVIELRVTKVFGESTVAKILALVENAGDKKATTENFITKFARYYTPVVVILAALIAVVPPLFFAGVWDEWIYRALVLLLISCPCALVISVPLGFFGGIGGASKQGILVKGANYLEALSKLDTVVFDKTGTLTEGKFKVVEIKEESGTKEELLAIAALAESKSNHPIARSIVEAAGGKVEEADILQYEEIAGKGVHLETKEGSILAGNEKLMHDFGLEVPASDALGTTVYLAKEGKYLGSILIADTIKEDAAKAISTLKKLGVRKTVMLTGDADRIGREVAKRVGIDEVHCELLPDGKVEKVEELLQKKQGKLAFVGDGINDAPVLARADLGIAMGGVGSDAAIEAADIVIMTDEPGKIADAMLQSRRTVSIVKQNTIFAIGVKVAVMAASFFGIPMWLAVFSDVGVSLLAVLNSMRALKSAK